LNNRKKDLSKNQWHSEKKKESSRQAVEDPSNKPAMFTAGCIQKKKKLEEAFGRARHWERKREKV